MNDRTTILLDARKGCLHLYENDNRHFQNIYTTWRIVSVEEKGPTNDTIIVSISTLGGEDYSPGFDRSIHRRCESNDR